MVIGLLITLLLWLSFKALICLIGMRTLGYILAKKGIEIPDSEIKEAQTIVTIRMFKDFFHVKH